MGMLALLFLANLAMLMGMTNWPQRTRESFANAIAKNLPLPGQPKAPGSHSLNQGKQFRKGVHEKFANPSDTDEQKKKGEGDGGLEPFMDYLVGGGFGTAPIGSYDGMNMAAGLPPAAQGFRGRMPDVPHPPGTEMLPFVNNECKPECCGASMSCDGGCICTTPEDRNLINTRGGNRKHEDGF